MVRSWTSLIVVTALATLASAQRGHGGSGGNSGSRSGGGFSGGRSSGGAGGGRTQGGFNGRSSRGSSNHSGNYGDVRSTGGYSGRSSGYNDRSSGLSGRPSGRYDGRSSRASTDYGRSSRSDFGGGSYGGRRSPFGYAGGRNDYGGRGRSFGGYGGRSGRYGGAYNGYGYGHAGPSHYGGGLGHSFLGVQIERNRPHVGYSASFAFGGVYGGLRYGYVGFGYGDPFFFPYYAYDPFAYRVVASPWYPYSYLPPYISQERVVVVDHYDPIYDGGSDWRDNNESRDDQAGLDQTLDDVRDAFERVDRREAERLLPDDGQVAVFNQGKYDYSLSANDFRDMFLDGVEGSKTTHYEIIERRVRNGEAHIRARHEFTDSYGKDQTVNHTYTLRRENGRYVIREFGSE